jgi:aldose 1-epimerase
MLTRFQQLTLQNSKLSLHLLPEHGGRIGRLQVRKHALEILQPIDASQSLDPLNWPKGGAYPLIPYSNRIANAQLHFEGQDYALPAHPQALPHTLHGVSHTLAWQVDRQSATQASLSLDYCGPHWPWPIRAEQHFELNGGSLRIRLALFNKGETPMPAGLGLHPYFLAHPQLQARLSCTRQWQITADYLSTGQHMTGDVTMQLDSQAWQTETCAHYLSQWAGRVDLDYPQGRLRLTASPELEHLVVFAPAGSPYLCIEPVSHLADGFNLQPLLGELSGTQVVAPGESFSVDLCFEWIERLQHPE